ncbi:hypothetical protein BD626DRAFT_475942 [Schizophyllum amplum]|uniref:Uncharacterized protein n=1 Tax=Schizophyllum amplum TaxID=97359 RepID=A0A550CYW7_9AGAR|nr:hypothetical protein BD626DRAFT_475942 [Auriculariopsis ampla]
MASMEDGPLYSRNHSLSSGERRSSGEQRSNSEARSSRGRLSSGDAFSSGGRLTTGEGLASGQSSRGPSSYPISPSPSQGRTRTSSSSSWVNLPPIEPLRLDNSRPPPPSFRPPPSSYDTQATDSGSWLHIPMPEPIRPFAVERPPSPRPIPIPRGIQDLPPSSSLPPPPTTTAVLQNPSSHDMSNEVMTVTGSPTQMAEDTKSPKRGFVGGFFRRLPKSLRPRPSEKTLGTRSRSGTMDTPGSVSTLPRYTSNPSTPDTNIAGLGAGSRLATRGQMQSIPEIRVPAALSRAPTPPQEDEPPRGRATFVDLSDVPASLRPGMQTSPPGGGASVAPLRPLSPGHSSGRASASTYKASQSRPTSGRVDNPASIFHGSRPTSAHTAPPDDSHIAVQAHLRPAPDYTKMGSPPRPGQPLSLSTSEPSFASQLGNPIQRFFRALNTMPWVAENVVGSYRPPPPKKALRSWYRHDRASARISIHAPNRRRMSGASTRTRTTIDLLSSRSPSRLSETSAGLSSPSSPQGDRGNYRASRPRPRTHRHRRRSPSEVPEVPPLPPGVYAYQPYPPASPSRSMRTTSSRRRAAGHEHHQRQRAAEAAYPGGYASPPGMYHPTPPTPLYVLGTPAGSQGGLNVSLMTPIYAQMALAPPAGSQVGGSPNLGSTPQAMPTPVMPMP